MENVSDPVTVHFEVAITQLANVVSASSLPCVPQEAFTLRGSEQFQNIVPLVAQGKYRNLKKQEQIKLYMAAGPLKPSCWEGATFPTMLLLFTLRQPFLEVRSEPVCETKR